jgi:hypothetical protein
VNMPATLERKPSKVSRRESELARNVTAKADVLDRGRAEEARLEKVRSDRASEADDIEVQAAATLQVHALKSASGSPVPVDFPMTPKMDLRLKVCRAAVEHLDDELLPLVRERVASATRDHVAAMKALRRHQLLVRLARFGPAFAAVAAEASELVPALALEEADVPLPPVNDTNSLMTLLDHIRFRAGQADNVFGDPVQWRSKDKKFYEDFLAAENE